MTKKIDELLAQTHEIEKEIGDIQTQCKHDGQKLKQVPERLDSTIMVVRWVCGDCKKTLRIPNKEEIDNYLLKE